MESSGVERKGGESGLAEETRGGRRGEEGEGEEIRGEEKRRGGRREGRRCREGGGERLLETVTRKGK